MGFQASLLTMPLVSTFRFADHTPAGPDKHYAVTVDLSRTRASGGQARANSTTCTHFSSSLYQNLYNWRQRRNLEGLQKNDQSFFVVMG
jgi:hypothetical protein